MRIDGKIDRIDSVYANYSIFQKNSIQELYRYQ